MVGAYSLAPDRERLAYNGVQFSPPASGLFVLDSSGAAVQVSEDVIPTDPAVSWSPDQNWIAFYGRPGTGLPEELFVAASDGSGIAQLSGPPIVDVVALPETRAWAPDSSRVAFSGAVPGVTRNLFTVRPDGTELVDLSGDLVTPASVNTEFLWSPDSAFLAFRAGERVYTAPAGGGSSELVSNQLLPLDDDELDFAWAPSGSRLVYRAGPVENSAQLFAADPDGGNTVQITTAVVDMERGWRIAPDGSSVAYVGQADSLAEFELRVAALDGSTDIRIGDSLSNSPGIQTFRWSPDSTRVAYVRYSATTIDLIAAMTDGSGSVSLAEDVGIDGFVPSQYAWSPDGTRVAFTGQRVDGTGGLENLLASNAAAGGDLRVHGGPYSLSTLFQVVEFKWSLDSSRLVYRLTTGPNLVELRRVPVDGSTPEVTLDGTPSEAAQLVQFDVR